MEPTMDTPFRWQGMPTTPQNPNMEGYGAAMGSAMANAETAYEDKKLRDELADLERQLSEIDLQIEKFDRENPGISSGMVDVAAKRAEAGDMGTYNAMVQNAFSSQLGNDGMLKSSRNGIENELKNAEKLTWGLDSKHEEQQNFSRNEINVALRSAEEWAEKTGQELPTSYYRLKEALKESSVGKNANELVNYYRYKQEKGELTEADRKYVEEVLRPKMNSEDFDNLFGFLKESKGKTVEAKRAEQKVKDIIGVIENLSPAEQEREWNKLSAEQRKIALKYAQWKTNSDGTTYLARKL